jgi:hypothetical protein
MSIEKNVFAEEQNGIARTQRENASVIDGTMQNIGNGFKLEDTVTMSNTKLRLRPIR